MSTETWSNKDELICPYCGHHYKIDHTEAFGDTDEMEFDDKEFECPRCENTYLIARRVQFTYITYKKGE